MVKANFSNKVIAVFIGLNFLVSLITVNQVLAQNNGPNAPEASGFEPVGATDMVNLSSGDMSYVLPLLEIDGFPVTLSYHAGIPMDMESSWVGLGWNINTGTIARGVVANPDDWGIGRRLNLTYLDGEIDSYSVNVGVGIAKAAEVGVGLSWGSNKSISGSVSASIGPLSASIDTNGNYSIGVSASAAMEKFGFGGVFDEIGEGGNKNNGGFGGSLSISGNVNKGGLAANIGVGGSSNGMSAGMGVSISSSGVGSSFSVGAGNNMKGRDKGSSGGSISMNSFSAGDYSYNTKGFYIPLQIGIFSFGFGHQKTEITLAKGFNKYGYGILYHNLNTLYNTDLGEDTLTYDDATDDYQVRNRYGDVYEQSLPQSEEEFIGDYRNQVEKLNFTFGGYDSYEINASGLGGALKPIVGQNTVLIGEGYDGASIRSSLKKTKVFYHNSKGQGNLMPSKGINKANTDPNKLNFSFDGQITENAIVNNNNNISIFNYTGSTLDIKNFISGTNTISSRPKSGSYVEVYTNTQIDAGAYIMVPASLKTDTGYITRNNAGYIMDGIGAYKVTTPDGKTYHFSQPVYHYEQIQHNFLNFDAKNVSKYNSSTKREATPYATHWLLTAITGPDYIDVNANNFADEYDYGYWLRLDHGQWTNAYTWRSPFDDKEYKNDDVLDLVDQSRRHYSTFIDNEVEKSDPGYFTQGRKDLYYLDKIVSKNQTALFVKDIRYDGYGTSADYLYSPGTSMFNDPIEGANTILSHEENIYDREYLLRLDKIIIIDKKESEILVDKTVGNGLAGINEHTPTTNRYKPDGFFDDNLPVGSNTHKLHMSDKVLDVNDFQNFDYSKASKVIKFNHSYNMAIKTPSSGYTNASIYPNEGSLNPRYGRLTLESVKTFGRGIVTNANENQLYDYMPPYIFEYKDKNLEHEENQIIQVPGTQLNLPSPLFSNIAQYKLDRANKDNWGFRNSRNGPDNNGDGVPDNNTVDAWSLNKITTPQGAIIEIDYEEDDFYVEAFGRRYWKENLQFYISDAGSHIIVEIENHPYANYPPNFTDYFALNERTYLDLWVCWTYHEERWPLNDNHDEGKVDVRPEDNAVVQEVNDNKVVLRIDKESYTIGGNDPGRAQNKWLARGNNPTIGSQHYFDVVRNDCEHNPGGYGGGAARNHNMIYTLLANKVAPGTSGGGLRVKDIVVNDNLGHKYITRYDYDNPFNGKTSGITSFNPIRGEVFVPYQNELPGPGVMYEWVTMKAMQVDDNNIEKEIGSTRYHYYTLKPIFDIFNPNIDMQDIDGESIFKAEVQEVNMGFSDLTAKNMRIEKNLTKIGQLISVEEFNEEGHLMSKTTNTYQPRVGELSETFSSMKSVFDHDEDDEYNETNFDLQQHYLSLSTKSEKVSVVKNIENITSAGKSTLTYSEPDEYLGTYTASLKTLADGTWVKEKKIPAYSKYPLMGSKINVYTNKNMLTQEAMTITSWSQYGNNYTWKTLDANITTWNDTWKYRDAQGNESTESGVWRKHKSFVWKDDIDSEKGTYLTYVDGVNSHFDWVDGIPTDEKWKNVSETTRYTHWSSPVEAKDINSNFASSKMADKDSKVIAVGNARYTEMYYCGAENMADNNYFDGEVEGAQYVYSNISHTGDNSLNIYSPSQKGFRITGKVGEDHFDDSKEFRPGNYKVSFWAYNVDLKVQENIRLKNNNVEIHKNNEEKVLAGDWVQLNYYFYLEPNTDVDLFITLNSDYSNNSDVYLYDDFRMHPLSTSMNSYVYDQNTDELNYILDANNMATKYVYDNAGRLCKLYKEVETNLPETDGGFKLVSQYRYNYQGSDSGDCDCCEDGETQAAASYPPLSVKSLTEIDKGAYIHKFNAEVSGGAGDFTYEWRWLTDVNTNSFSDFVIGNNKQDVPFAVKICDTKSNLYDKYWSVEVKITDNVTEETIIQKEEVIESGCKFFISEAKWADIEISSNYESCNPLTKYTLRPFVIKPDESVNYSYLYQTFDHKTSQWSGYTPITSSKNTFCGNMFYAPSNECKSEYLLYQTAQYRVINVVTGDIYQSNILDVYLDCVENPAEDLKLPSNEIHEKHGTLGNVVEKNVNNEVINVYNALK